MSPSSIASRHGRAPSVGRASRRASGVEQARFYIFVGFLVLCFLGGGSARGDVMSLLYVRPAAVLCIVALLVLPGRVEWRIIRIPLLLLAALALVMTMQLIPLPPDIWSTLPGHARFLEAAEVAGIAQPWRPISISPDATLNSLVSLIVPLAALVGIASITREQRYALLPLLIIAALVSAFLGVAQLAGGSSSSLRFYRITNEGAPVGLFANRNHQAALLAMTIPMLALWAFLNQGDRRLGRATLWIAFPAILFLLPMILVTGSRAGLFLAAVALVLSYWLFARPARKLEGSKKGGKWERLARYAPWVVCAVVLVVTILLSRAQALQRLVEIDPLMESRFRLLPAIVNIAREFMPFGSGFGAFDPTFRIFEPFSNLKPQYLNHAHNDPLEILIEGGLFSAALVVLFLAWFIWGVVGLFRNRNADSRAVRFGQLGALFVLLLLGASVVDYPIRVPIFAAIFAIACFWLSAAQGRVRDRAEWSDSSAS